jgi:hypothetical protein
MIFMTKRKKTSELLRTARHMGKNIGMLVMESKERGRVIAKTGSKKLRATAETLGKAGKKAEKRAKTTAQETIPQLMREFRRGLKEGMKKK